MTYGMAARRRRRPPQKRGLDRCMTLEAVLCNGSAGRTQRAGDGCANFGFSLMPPLTNSQRQARWRAKNNALAAVGREYLNASPARKAKRETLEAQVLRLSRAWTFHLDRFCDAKNCFENLKDAPASAWRSEQLAEALERMHYHEKNARTFDATLRIYESQLKTHEQFDRTMSESRAHLRRRR